MNDYFSFFINDLFWKRPASLTTVNEDPSNCGFCKKWLANDMLQRHKERDLQISTLHSGLWSIWILTGTTPCTGLFEARHACTGMYRHVPVRPTLCWSLPGFSTRPIIGTFDLPHWVVKPTRLSKLEHCVGLYRELSLGEFFKMETISSPDKE